MKIQKLVLAVLGIGLISTATVHADDWAQWRGQKRDGTSQEKGLIKSWSADSPKLLWQAKNIGFGYSTPSVVGTRLYVQSNEGNESESVRAFDTKDGKPLWSTKIGKVGNPNQQPNYPGARSTPTIDGKMLYALGSDGDLSAIYNFGRQNRLEEKPSAPILAANPACGHTPSPLLLTAKK